MWNLKREHWGQDLRSTANTLETRVIYTQAPVCPLQMHIKVASVTHALLIYFFRPWQCYVRWASGQTKAPGLSAHPIAGLKGRRKTMKVSYHIAPNCRGWLAVNQPKRGPWSNLLNNWVSMPVGIPLDESAASVGDKGNRSLAFLCIEWVLGGLELAGPEKAEKAEGRNGGKEEASGPPGNVRGDKERDPSPTLRKHTRPERAESGKKAPESPENLTESVWQPDRPAAPSASTRLSPTMGTSADLLPRPSPAWSTHLNEAR